MRTLFAVSTRIGATVLLVLASMHFGHEPSYEAAAGVLAGAGLLLGSILGIRLKPRIHESQIHESTISTTANRPSEIIAASRKASAITRRRHGNLDLKM